MAEDQDQERTLPATERRLERAREEGQAARSPELVAAAGLLSACIAWWLGGADWIAGFENLMRAGLQVSHSESLDSSALLRRLGMLSDAALLTVAPLAGIAAVAAIGGSIAVGGWIFSWDALAPKMSRMSPMAAAGRIFSLQGLGELTKMLAKAAFLGAAGAWTVWQYRETAAGLSAMDLSAALAMLGRMLLSAFGSLVLAMLLIAALDVPFQLWRFHKGLRMTPEEVKREARESEGDPQVKGRIRAQQREMARRRMMSEVPKADVIVTNPTHYSVALSYRDGEMRAPQVVAKGADEVAKKIRELGAAHQVPLLEAPPLARALFKHAEVGDEVPAALYGAVAEVLAWVFQLRRQIPGTGRVQAPRDIPVPAGLDPAENLK